MIIKIKNKEHSVHFGMRFVRELDKAYFASSGATKYGVGLNTRIPLLYDRDAVVLSDMLYLGTITEKSRPTKDQVDEYVENHENIEGLFLEVLEELKKGNTTKLKTNQLVAELDEALAKMEEQKKLEEELEAERIEGLQRRLTKTS